MSNINGIVNDAVSSVKHNGLSSIAQQVFFFFTLPFSFTLTGIDRSCVGWIKAIPRQRLMFRHNLFLSSVLYILGQTATQKTNETNQYAVVSH